MMSNETGPIDPPKPHVEPVAYSDLIEVKASDLLVTARNLRRTDELYGAALLERAAKTIELWRLREWEARRKLAISEAARAAEDDDQGGEDRPFHDELSKALDLACARISDGPQEYHEANTAKGWRESYLRRARAILDGDIDDQDEGVLDLDSATVQALRIDPPNFLAQIAAALPAGTRCSIHIEHERGLANCRTEIVPGTMTFKP